MKVVVLGASGMIGRHLVRELAAKGVDTVAAQRSSGVDAYSGSGLQSAFAGADAVVDATNVTTTRAKVAVDFFGTVAANVSAAARSAGVSRVVCLSIINAADPEVNAKFGYYQGKGEQEKVYRERLDAATLTVVRSAQWYELAGQMIERTRFGPVAVVPHMLSRPLAAADAARVLADAATAPTAGDVEVAGPAEMDMVDVAKAYARQEGSPRWVIGVNIGGSAMRSGGLLPHGDVERASTTFGDWLKHQTTDGARR
ncbi:NAD(P)H-binding protein [Gordonia sp. VNK1]|uniref:SDR family oxidoreductase n=1 Tax=Gordonia oleivorans TaxID=3156618 RepID=UPI0032B45EA7